MVDKADQEHRFNWRLPLAALLSTPLIFLIVAIFQSESLVYLFFMVPIISVVLIVFAVYSAIARKKLRSVSILSMLAIFWVLSVPLFKNYLAVRSAARWLIWSDDYKARVVAQPAPANGDLKHLDWDGWGWGGENTEVYLVFSIRQIRWRRQPEAINPASSTDYPAKSIVCFVWRATGTLPSFTQVLIGTIAIEAMMPDGLRFVASSLQDNHLLKCARARRSENKTRSMPITHTKCPSRG
ncbi:MAG: hypothetical protein ABSF40_12650 [Candidatus Acidiferrales bacterium]